MPRSDPATSLLTATRVATLPARHAYVDAVLPVGTRHVAAGRPVDLGWRPDPLWEPENVRRQAPGIDVVHVHFGFDHVPPAQLTAWAEAVRTSGAGLVLTVHDLRSPHQADRTTLDAQLAVLVPAADAVLTLTPGAADEIQRRFGRAAQVVPHPAVFDAPAPVATEPGLVGVHVKSLRTNVVDGVATVEVVAAAVAEAGGRLQVDVHDDVADRTHIAELASIVAAAPDASLRSHDRFDDDQLRTYLTGLHVSVMVNRFGTHSGWVEACHDVGTTVVAPDCGYYRQQWPELVGYHHTEADGLDAPSLHHAVIQALARPAAAPADPQRRSDDLARVRAVHDEVYRRCRRP